MADKSKDERPIVIKIKRGGHGHHGGAWKVAYADFVTAMMAFPADVAFERHIRKNKRRVLPIISLILLLFPMKSAVPAVLWAGFLFLKKGR